MSRKKKIEIKLDPNNARLHGDKSKELIRKSIEELGAGRSIVIDSEDYVIAGNGVIEQANALGIKTRVIETDGTELVVVKRKDLKYDDPKRRRLAIADNAVQEASEFDFDFFEDEDYEDWGIERPKENKEKVEGDILFSNELDRANNYIVLKFETDIDWINAKTILDIDSRYSKRTTGKAWSKGIGRVLDGVGAIEKIKESVL